MLFLIELWESVRGFIATGGGERALRCCLCTLIDVDNDDRTLLVPISSLPSDEK